MIMIPIKRIILSFQNKLLMYLTLDIGIEKDFPEQLYPYYTI